MTRSAWAQPLAPLLTVLALIGCGQPDIETGVEGGARRISEPSDSPSPRYGGHLRVAQRHEPTSLDAVLGRSGFDTY
jgi:hypothetical protein